jgi:hypothetical protein
VRSTEDPKTVAEDLHNQHLSKMILEFTIIRLDAGPQRQELESTADRCRPTKART